MWTLSNWTFQEDKNNLRPMRASRWHLFLKQVYVPTGIFHLRQILKIKKYDAIDKKYVRGRVWFTRKCSLCSQNVLVGKKIAQKEMPMTINERRWRWTRAREVLTHLSTAYLADLPKLEEYVPKHMETSRSMCQNICRVRAEYALSTRKMGTRIWAPTPGWGL